MLFTNNKKLTQKLISISQIFKSVSKPIKLILKLTFYYNLQSFLAILGIFTTFFSCFNLPIVKTNANTSSISQFMIVTNLRGINVRDKNCNIIGRIGSGEILEKGVSNPTQIKCKIGETEMTFVNYWAKDVKTSSTEQFVAVNFIQNVITDTSIRNKKLPNLVIKNEMGANLRNNDCQKVLRVPNKTVSSKDIIIKDSGKNVCKVGEEFYMMENFIHQNRNYYVAEVLTKYE